MSLALNILVTILIVVQLLIYRNRINNALGKSHGAHYASVVAMIVESAAIYSSFALLFLVPFALNHPLSQIFIQSLPPVQVCTGLLIQKDTNVFGRTSQRSSLSSGLLRGRAGRKIQLLPP